MKTFKIIGIILLVIILLIVGYGMMLSGEAHLKQSIVIDAPASKVFNEVNRFTNLKEWSPWSTLDPNTRYEFTGPEYGVGAAYSWDSDNPNVRQGTQKIIISREGEYVQTQMDFGINGKYYAEFILEPVDDGTKVTWTYDGKTNNFIWRILLKGSEEEIGSMYKTGLISLKTYIENLPNQIPDSLEPKREGEKE